MGQIGKVTELTHERVKYLFNYDPETGIFIRMNEGRKNSPIGGVAGYKNSKGYIIIKVDGEAYKAHRLAWLYFYGYMPKGEVDHINGVTDDNRICNIRDVSSRENVLNKRQYREGICKKGACRNDHGGWTCTIRDGKHRRNLGSYATPEEAQAVYFEVKTRIENGEHLEDFYKEYGMRLLREILCVETGEVFSSAKDAAIWAGCASTNIVACCRGRYNTMKGYHWKYVRERCL